MPTSHIQLPSPGSHPSNATASLIMFLLLSQHAHFLGRLQLLTHTLQITTTFICMQAHKTHILYLLLTQSHTYGDIQRHAISVSALPLILNSRRHGLQIKSAWGCSQRGINQAKQLEQGKKRAISLRLFLSVRPPSLTIHRLPSRVLAPFRASLFARFPQSPSESPGGYRGFTGPLCGTPDNQNLVFCERHICLSSASLHHKLMFAHWNIAGI